MAIECNEISQTVNTLLIAFKDCNKILNSDLRKLVELVAAVNTCTNGGRNYNTLVTKTYEPGANLEVVYPVNTFHAITIIVLTGSITYNTFTLPSGTTQNIEVTTLNQTALSFTVNAGSRVLVEYLIETV